MDTPKSTMLELPFELQEQILSRMHPLDRLSFGLTCRRLADLMYMSSYLKEILFVIRGGSAELCKSLLMRSRRKYWNLKVHRTDLSEFDAEFWSRVGGEIRTLEIYRCRWSTANLHAILQHCTNLESFEFGGWLPLALQVEAPDNVYLMSAVNIRHLHLDISLTVDSLDRLLQWMPKLTSVSLSRLPVLKTGETLRDIPSILESQQRLTRLQMTIEGVDDSVAIRLVKKHSTCLRELRMHYRYRPTEGMMSAICECEKLRILSMQGVRGEIWPERLFSECPDLETLDVTLIGATGLCHRMERLKKLRELRLPSDTTPDWAGISDCLSTLRMMEVRLIPDSLEQYQNLSRFKELRALTLSGVEPTPECFAVLVENLDKLEQFELECENLTDSDGVKFNLLRNLRRLKLNSASGFTDVTFESGIGSPALEKLALECCLLSDEGLARIAAHHRKMTEIVLTSCNALTDDGVLNFLQREYTLRRLALNKCAALTEGTVSAVATVCPRLRSFRWISYPGLSRETVTQFVQRRPEIEILEI
ncbi:uncharacterized protein LOC100904255 [Galendromus occidentalis]|uniref:Uncharacterized protein LOC100904255 n=1 Tax=Galendromus occidentalis TaxID=34638 RepID=A0AAJ6QP35_9ACAR|nr:uncharacterized protein LOC100904255 [Galendromus occidentalis]